MGVPLPFSGVGAVPWNSLLGTSVLLQHSMTTLTLTNESNTAMFAEIYYFKFKKDISTAEWTAVTGASNASIVEFFRDEFFRDFGGINYGTGSGAGTQTQSIFNPKTKIWDFATIFPMYFSVRQIRQHKVLPGKSIKIICKSAPYQFQALSRLFCDLINPSTGAQIMRWMGFSKQFGIRLKPDIMPGTVYPAVNYPSLAILSQTTHDHKFTLVPTRNRPSFRIGTTTDMATTGQLLVPTTKEKLAFAYA